MLEGFAGQRVALQVIRNVLGRDWVPHAYLIHGPRGVGKARAALSLGRVLACHAPIVGGEEIAPCGDCPSCRLSFRPGSHHDLVCIEPLPPESKSSSDGSEEGPSADEQVAVAGGVVRIEQVREAERTLNRSLVAARRRVCIVPDAERMCRQPAAGNAFLKTLEEPPPSTVIILTSSNMADLLPTMISRCLPLPFVTVMDEALIRDLQELTTGPRETLLDETHVTRAQAELAGRVSAGRRAFAEALVTRPELERVREEVLDILRAAFGGDRLATLRAPDRLADLCVTWWGEIEGVDVSTGLGAQAKERILRHAIPEVLALLESYIRDMIVSASGGDHGNLINLDRVGHIRDDAGRMGVGSMARRLEVLSTTRRMVGQNASCRLALEVALMRMRGA